MIVDRLRALLTANEHTYPKVVLTRPLGPAVADRFSKREGVGLGTGLVSLGSAAAIVRHLARTGKDTPSDQFGRTVPT